MWKSGDWGKVVTSEGMRSTGGGVAKKMSQLFNKKIECALIKNVFNVMYL